MFSDVPRSVRRSTNGVKPPQQPNTLVIAMQRCITKLDHYSTEETAQLGAA